MLAELSIDDLVLIAAARLEFSPGLNVITGETGAGKSLLAQAIGLLMGQKGGDELVRPGAARALVQALFENGDETLAVARELPRGGRSRARMDGLLSSAAAVEDALRRRLAFYGQLEHTRLLQLERQLDLLDGAVADERRAAQGRVRRGLRTTRAGSRASSKTCAAPAATASASSTCCATRWARSRPRAWSRARTSASSVERERARHAGKLLERTGGALALLAGESRGRRPRRRARGAAPRRRGGAARREPGAAGGAARRAGRRARRPRGGAARLHRRAGRRRRRTATHSSCATTSSRALMRKYGGSADEVLAYLEEARGRLSALEEFAADEESLVARVAAAQDARGRRRRAPQRGAAAARAAGGRAHRGGAAQPGHAARDVRRSRSRRAARAGTASGLRAPTRSSSSSAPIPACRRGRCARRPRAASSRAPCSPSAAS